MPLTEDIREGVAEEVFQSLLGSEQQYIERCVIDDYFAVKQAFKEALNNAYESFSEQHSEIYLQLFNISFWEHEGAYFLAQFFRNDGQPDPGKLAILMAESLNKRQPGPYNTYVRPLERIAVNFLDFLAQAFKAQSVLKELSDSRAMNYLSQSLRDIRLSLNEKRATMGTRYDYLCWLKEQTLYLDPRGMPKTQFQVQPELDEIYIELEAQLQVVPSVPYSSPGQERPEKTSENSVTEQEHLEETLENGAHAQKGTKYPDVVTLAETISSYDHLVILGEPGSGKSTWLSYVAFHHARALLSDQTEVGITPAGIQLGPARFPILIPIVAYAEFKGKKVSTSLIDFLDNYFRTNDCPLEGLIDLLTTELAERNCLILLDGLDHIIEIEERLNVIGLIEEIVSRYDGRPHKYVVTSRVADYQSAPLNEPFVHYRIREMGEPQIRQFLEKWYEHIILPVSGIARDNIEERDKREIEKIMYAVQTNPSIRRLAGTPLLLSILAFVYIDRKPLPQKRIELYVRTTETLIHSWRPLPPQFPLPIDEFLNALLSRIAYWLHSVKSTGMAPLDAIHKELCQELELLPDVMWDNEEADIARAVTNFLYIANTQMGILAELAPKQYGFIHQTFEEYYTARYLVKRSKTREKLIREHLHDPHWDEPILLALGFIGLETPEDASDLLETAILSQKIDETRVEDIFVWDYLFALRCLRDQIPVNLPLMKKLMRQMSDELLHHTGIARFQLYQEALWKYLEQLRASKAASVLSPYFVDALIKSEEESVRRRAARGLGLLGEVTGPVIKALYDSLCKDTFAVRRECAQSLAQLAQIAKEAGAALLHAVQRSENPFARRAGAEGLGRLQRPYDEVKVIGALLHIAKTDADAPVRWAAVEGLGRLQCLSTEIITTLLHIVKAEPNSPLCRYAVKSLGQLKCARDDVIAALLDTLRNSEDDTICQQAAKSLGMFDSASNQIIEELLHTLNTDRRSLVRSAAAESLKHHKLTNDEQLNSLFTALEKDDFMVCISVIEVLEKVREPHEKVEMALVNKMLDIKLDFRVRCAAMQALGQMEQPSTAAIDKLFNCACRDSDIRVVPTAMEVLKKLAQSSDKQVSGEVKATLRKSLDQGDLRVSLTGSRILVRLPFIDQEEKIAEALYHALHNDDNTTRYLAAESLGQLRCQEQSRYTESWEQVSTAVMETLFEAMCDQRASGRIRREAARLLGKIGPADARTVNALYEELADSKEEVIEAVARGLALLSKRTRNAKIEQEIIEKLTRAIGENHQPTHEPILDNHIHDYAFDGLWLLNLKGLRLTK